MKNIIKFIAKWEGGKNGNPILFFPEYKVNRGRMACYTRVGEHSEACLTYYRGLKNPITDTQKIAVQSLVMIYFNNKLEPHENLKRVWRDSQNMQKQREV